ncbi:hypothetical protein [Nocardia noduli]|uniref:hypothetical protein n=1 Tax=Nocardia noduli TaxID=2815722 RepID=UPI001C22CEA1|nr:hypothetical protein [Nocardia noduli]
MTDRSRREDPLVAGSHDSHNLVRGPIPWSSVLFRAWQAAPVGVTADDRHSRLVTEAIQLLDAHHRHRGALSQLVRLPADYDDTADLDVVLDGLHRAHRDITATIARIDQQVAVLVPGSPQPGPPAPEHPNGFGVEVLRLAQRWSAASTTTVPGPIRTRAISQLSTTAIAYDLLAADVTAGRKRLPSPGPPPGEPCPLITHPPVAETGAFPHTIEQRNDSPGPGR